MELKKKLAEFAFNARVEMRYGFYDKCGDFCEVEANPYSGHQKHRQRALCYLAESRELNSKEIEGYQQDNKDGRLKFMPTEVEWWDVVPNFPESLDVCFKWLVPKVYEQYGEAKTRELLEVWAWYIASGAYWGKEAKALAIAIEKLIDKEATK